VSKVYRNEPHVWQATVGSSVIWRWTRSRLPCDEYGINLPTHGGASTEVQAWAAVHAIEKEQQKLREISAERDQYDLVFVKK